MLAAIVGGALALPSVGVGELLDDHLLRAWARSDAPRWDAFHFIAPGELGSLREQGMFGWWASEQLSLQFARPLSAFTHALDHALWPAAVWLMHLENVALYALLCWLVARLFMRVHGPGLAVGVAALVFAIDESHAATVGWISARNTMLALGFGIAALLCHLRWRGAAQPRTWSPWLPGALLCFACALASAEGGLCSFGYLLAWSLCFERGALWRRLAPLLPYVAIILPWLLAYELMGFGGHGSGIYLDVGAEPLRFAGRLLLWPALIIAAQLSLPMLDLLLGAPLLAVALLLVFGAACWALWPLLRDDPRARFWLLGMSFACVPLATTYPTARTSMLACIGGAALIGLAWARRSNTQGRGRRALLGLLFVCNLVLAPLGFVPVSYSSMIFEPPHRTLARELPERAPVCVMLNVPAELTSFYPAAIRRATDRPWPAHSYSMFAGMQPLEVERVGARTLELHAASGWAALAIDRFSNDWRHGFVPGDVVTLARVQIEVLETTADRRPTRVRAVFDRDLDELAIYGFGRDGSPGSSLARWQPQVGERARFIAGL